MHRRRRLPVLVHLPVDLGIAAPAHGNRRVAGAIGGAAGVLRRLAKVIATTSGRAVGWAGVVFGWATSPVATHVRPAADDGSRPAAVAKRAHGGGQPLVALVCLRQRRRAGTAVLEHPVRTAAHVEADQAQSRVVEAGTGRTGD